MVTPTLPYKLMNCIYLKQCQHLNRFCISTQFTHFPHPSHSTMVMKITSIESAGSNRNVRKKQLSDQVNLSEKGFFQWLINGWKLSYERGKTVLYLVYAPQVIFLSFIPIIIVFLKKNLNCFSTVFRCLGLNRHLGGSTLHTLCDRHTKKQLNMCHIKKQNNVPLSHQAL